ncbi:MAG: hypothetical protein WDW38_000199 [Sanguina aurantia]
MPSTSSSLMRRGARRATSVTMCSSLTRPRTTNSTSSLRTSSANLPIHHPAPVRLAPVPQPNSNSSPSWLALSCSSPWDRPSSSSPDPSHPHRSASQSSSSSSSPNAVRDADGRYGNASQEATPSFEELISELDPEEQKTVRLFQATCSSVVNISTSGAASTMFPMNMLAIPRGVGSGFVYDKRGHVVTNAHVIRGAETVRVTLNDHATYLAKVVGKDVEKDVAVLKLDISDAAAALLSPVTLGSSSRLLVGQKVYALGNPFGLDQTLTSGIISGLGRQINAGPSQPGMGAVPISNVIQTDASINPGNSGGPLFDSRGRLVGVNTAILDPTGLGVSSGVGFAIPIDSVRGLVDQILTSGKTLRPSLGISLAPPQLLAQLAAQQKMGNNSRFGGGYTPNSAQRDRIPTEGVLVLSVKAKGPADLAGLQPTRREIWGELVLGDVIVGVNGSACASRRTSSRRWTCRGNGSCRHMGSSSGVINSGSGRRPGLPLLSGLRLARPVHRAASASATSQTTATPSRTGWSACGSAASSCARPSHAQHPCTHAASTARALHITTSAPDARQRPCRSSRSSTHAGSCGISGTTGSSSSSSSSSSRSSSTRGTPRAPSASALRRASSVHPHSSTARGVHPPTTTGAALPRSATSLEHGVAPGRCRAPSDPAHDRQRSSVSAQGSVDLGDLLLDDELVVGGLTPGQLGSYIQRGASSYSVQTDVGTPTRGGTGSSSSRPAATDRQRGSSAAGPVDNDLDDPPSLTPPGGSDGGGDGGGGGGSSSKGRMNGGSSSGSSSSSRPSADAAQPGYATPEGGSLQDTQPSQGTRWRRPPRPLDPTQSADPDDAAQAALGEAPHAARPAPSSPGRPPHPRSTLAAIASITSLEQLDAVFRELSTAAPPPWPDTSTPPHTRDPRSDLHPSPAQGASSATAPLHSHTHTLTASTPPSATLAAGPAPLPAARVERVLLGCLDARHLSTLIYRLALLLPSPDQQQQQQQQHGSDGGHGPDGAAAAQLARQREQSLMRRLLRACVPLFRSFNPVDVTMLLNGVVIAGYVPQSSWLTPFLGHCLEALPRFGARNLAGVVWALAAMGASPGEVWMGRMCGCAERRFAEFTPQALSLLLWAVARLQHTPSPAWLASWFAASAPLLPSSNAQNLAVSLWAVTRLTARQPSLPLSTAWLSQWHAASAARLPSFTGQGLSMLLWSHAQLNIPLQHQQPHAPGAQPPLGQDSPIPLTAPTGTAPGRAQPTSSSQPGAVSHPAGQPSGRTAPRLTLAEVLEAVTHQLHLMEPQHLAVTLWGVSVLAGHQDPAGACSASSPAGSPDGRQRAQGDGGHSADRGLRPVGAPSRDPRPDLPPQLPQPSGAPQQRQQRRRDSDAEASPQQPQQQLQQQLRFQLATLGSDEDSQRQQQQQPRQASSAAAQQQQQQQQQQGPDAAWVRRVASACEDVMSEFEPQGLAMVGRALSQLSYKANKKWMAAYLEVGSLPTRVGQMASTAPEQQQQQQQGVQASTALSRAQPGQPNSSSPPAAAVPGVAIKPEELAMMMWSVGKLEFVPGSITWVHQVEAAALRQLPRQHHHLGSTPASDSGHPPDASSDSGHPVDSSSDSGHPVDSSSDSGHPVDSSSDSGRPVDSSSDSGRPVTLDLASHVPASVSQAAAVLRPQHVCSMLYCFARIHAPCPAFLLAATEWMLSHQAQSELRRSGGALPLLHARHGPGLNGSSGVTAGRNGAGVGGSSRNGADSSTDSSTSSSTSSSLVHRSSDRSSSSLVDRSSNRSTSSSNSSNGSSNRSNSSSDSSSGGGGGGGRGVAVPAGLSSRDVAMWLWACASLGHDPGPVAVERLVLTRWLELVPTAAHMELGSTAPTARHRCMTGRVADRLVGVFFPSEKVRGMADTRAVQQWVSWAVLRLGIVPPPAWVDALAARFYATLPLASLLTLSTLLRSLLALGYVPTRAWVVAVRAGSDQCMKRCTQSKRKRGLLWEAVLLQLKGLSEVARTGVGNASSDWPPVRSLGPGGGGFRGPAGPGPGAPGGAVSGPARAGGDVGGAGARGQRLRRGGASREAGVGWGCSVGVPPSCVAVDQARGRAWERGAERAHTVAAECAFQSVAPGACESQQAGWCRAKAT